MDCFLDSEHKLKSLKSISSVITEILKMSKKCKLKKGHISEKKIHFELSASIAWSALWIVNTYSKSRVNTFSNNRDITKCQILHNAKDDTKATAIPWFFSNKRAKMALDCSPEFLR